MIDYKKLANAQEFYLRRGFGYMEVPWIIDEVTDAITRPGFILGIETNYGGNLVASGEQSFLQISSELPGGKYQTITPCFRREEREDNLHHKWFMKNELIMVGVGSVDEMINEAKLFFQSYLPIDIVKTDIGWDIESGGYELGSYGEREYEGFKWIYGTGCAEPRLSTVLKIARGWDII